MKSQQVLYAHVNGSSFDRLPHSVLVQLLPRSPRHWIDAGLLFVGCILWGLLLILIRELFVFGCLQYFNYMGMLATEGTYDKMDALLNQGIHPVDILLLMASSEGDQPKVEELLKAGARSNITNLEGKTALDIAATDAVRELIASSSIASVWLLQMLFEWIILDSSRGDWGVAKLFGDIILLMASLRGINLS